METVSDEQIAQSVQRGDADLFGELIERYEQKLKRYARKFLSQPDDIEDLVQDVFIKSYTHIQSFDPEQRFSSWIYRIAHNVFVNELRRKGRRGYELFDIDVFLPQLSAQETADRATLANELYDEMNELLFELSPKYREIIILFYYQELSYEEIGEVLKIPKTTVGVRIMRARERLKKLYNEKDT